MDVSPNRDAVLASLTTGSRVMIRRRMSPAEIAENVGTLHENTTLTDVVGEVLELSPTDIVVRTRTTTSHIQIANIVVAKLIPSTIRGRHAPHRSISTNALERISSAGWGGSSSENLGNWSLRYTGGYTARANSCLVLGEPPMPLSHTLDAVREWYISRQIRPQLQLPLDRGVPPHSDPLVIEARQHGWAPHETMAVMTASVEDVRAQAGPSTVISTRWSSTVEPAWWSLADERMRANPDSARKVLTSSDPHFITAFDEETPIARARMTIQRPWGGLFALYTAPSHRGHGVATHLLSECATYAAEHGISSLYLQVVSSNQGAIRLYEKLGLSVHHEDVYLEPTSQQ